MTAACSTQVADFTGYHFHNCSRKAKVVRKGWGYCKQHDPEVREAKREAKQAEYDAEWDKRKAIAGRNRAARDIAGFLAEYVKEDGPYVYLDALVGDDDHTTLRDLINQATKES